MYRRCLDPSLPFVLAPFLIVAAIAILYARYQGLTWVQDVFFGSGQQS